MVRGPSKRSAKRLVVAAGSKVQGSVPRSAVARLQERTLQFLQSRASKSVAIIAAVALASMGILAEFGLISNTGQPATAVHDGRPEPTRC